MLLRAYSGVKLSDKTKFLKRFLLAVKYWSTQFTVSSDEMETQRGGACDQMCISLLGLMPKTNIFWIYILLHITYY